MPDPWEVRFDIVSLPTGPDGRSGSYYRARFDNGWTRCDPWANEEHRHPNPEEAVDCLRAVTLGLLMLADRDLKAALEHVRVEAVAQLAGQERAP